jgi:hypothetical protein
VKSMLSIGASVKAVKQARRTILKILQSGMEQETIRTALTTLGTLCNVSGVAIQNCAFTSKGGK